MAVLYNTQIPIQSLVFFIDATNVKSWPGSGTSVFDVSGNNNHFTYRASGSATTPVISETSFSFNGSTQYLETTGNDCITFSTPYTMGSLLKFNNISSSDYSFPTYNNYSESTNTYGLWHHYVSSGIISYRHWPTSGTGISADLSGHGLSNGAWALTVISWDGATLKLYKNGVLQNSVAMTTGFNAGGTGRKGRIGMLANRSTSGDYNYNGLIKTSFLYDRALSDDEILILFQAMRGKVNI